MKRSTVVLIGSLAMIGVCATLALPPDQAEQPPSEAVAEPQAEATPAPKADAFEIEDEKPGAWAYCEQFIERETGVDVTMPAYRREYVIVTGERELTANGVTDEGINFSCSIERLADESGWRLVYLDGFLE